MLKRSCLLEYLLAYADKLKAEDRRGALTANYFMISVLKTVQAVEEDQIPAEIDNQTARSELESLRNMLEPYHVDKDRVLEVLSLEVKAAGADVYIDEFMFRNLLGDWVERVAQRNDRDEVDAPLLMEQIIAHPTDAIKQTILKPQEQTPDTSSASDRLAKYFQEIEQRRQAAKEAGLPEQNREIGAYEEDEEDEEDEQEETVTGTQRLAAIVQTTRDIQSYLLKNIYGQDQAVNAFASGYFQAQLMEYHRSESQKPAATFLFAGPPGVGKTFLAEQAAKVLALPFRRFDMSEYADKEANLEFCGTDKVYKNAKAGNVTEFVSENPRCVLLFDEVEKAHINVIHLFLQMLDAGRLRDNYTDEEVSFTNAVIIFTTNAGRNLYEDPSIVSLSTVPKKKVLRALASDVNPISGTPLFPAAICSRFASGNVVMFNHLQASDLYTIAKRELERNAEGLEKGTGIKVTLDERVASVIMFSEGGKADARTVKGRANAFFHEELYELFRLMASNKGNFTIEELEQIRFSVPLEGCEPSISRMFENSSMPEVLVFADDALATVCRLKLEGRATCHVAQSLEEGKDILFHHDITLVLCDIRYGRKENDVQVLNAEDVTSLGHDFLDYVLEKYALPVYLLQRREADITQEEFLSFAKLGVRDMLCVHGQTSGFAKQVLAKCKVAYQQGNMLKLARENKALSYETAQTVSRNRKVATIQLFDFHLGLITDAEDSGNILDQVSRPNLHFEDVIGAEDAKEELKYFVEYLKNPIKYMRRGVRSPKGILLYGPPGTGKTMLAKAMAGESGVTFLRAEGNDFLKRYVGEGTEAVHALFNSARKYAPAIIFVDEIDAIARDRSDAEHSGDVLTAFLTEMDGFRTDTSRPVFVLAATNYGVDQQRGKSLDPALLRRFDRRIYVDLPNKEERMRFLEMKLKKHPAVQLSREQLENIALRSTGMSLATLESVFEMALRNAIRSETGVIGDGEFEEAFETFTGGEKKQWSADSLIRTARHEAGHALICWLGGEKPTYLTIVARGDHGGYMQHANNEEKGQYTRSELLHRIRTAMGGRAAEMVYYGDQEGQSTGASGDLLTATRIAEQMICIYGMDQQIGMSYRGDKPLSQAERDRVNNILSTELGQAIRLIESNRQVIDELVDALMEKNHLKEKEIDAILCRTLSQEAPV